MFEFPLIPLVHVADIRMGQSPDSTYVQEGTEQGVPFLQGNAEFGVKYPTAKYSCIQPPRIAEPGSSLISVRAPVGETNIADQTYCIGRGLSAVSFHRYGEVLGRELLNFHAKDLDKVSQGTTFAAISGNELKSLLIAEIPEQEAAVLETILDTLDTQIQKTEALIAKLKKVKEGLLHDLLTRGIDENGQLRPSPEQAPELYKESPLGLIPREWDALSIGQLSVMVTSGSRGWAEYYSDSGDLFIRSQNVRMGVIDLTDQQYVIPPCDGEGQRTSVSPCDLLVTITGNSVGNVAHLQEGWNRAAFVSQHVGLIRFLQPELSKFAEIFLVKGAPGNGQLLDAQYGQSKPGLSLDNLKSIVIPIPPQHERDGLAGRIESIKARISAEKVSLDKLNIQKSGLMDDLLTGRVRVTSLLEQAQEAISA